jgi:hypothetical protein
MKVLQKLSLLQVVLLMAFIFNACTDRSSKGQAPASQDQLVFDKLIGTWQNEDGKSFERWAKTSNENYSAVGFTIKGTDTSWNEQASIYQLNGNWVFEHKVQGQNEGRSIKFTSSKISSQMVQFSNPAHDFPIDINYSIVDSNTLKAFIIGPNDKGGKDTIPFNFKKHSN